MSSINAAAASTINPRDAGASRFNELSSEDFIRIIFTELQNQDPLNPSDTSALLEQLNSIRSIESDIQLSAKLDSLVTENQLSTAGTLIGKFIGGLTDDSQRVAGYVVSVIRQDDDIYCELDNHYFVNVGSVETIIDPDQLQEAPPHVGDTNNNGDNSGDANGDGSGDSTPADG